MGARRTMRIQSESWVEPEQIAILLSEKVGKATGLGKIGGQIFEFKTWIRENVTNRVIVMR